MSRKIKYTKSFKRKAVEKVLKENLGITKVSDHLGIHKSILRKWISYYQQYGVSGLTPRKSNTAYPDRFKLKVIRSIERKGLSYKAAGVKYNIPSASTVRKWHLTFLSEGVEGLTKDGRGRSRSMKSKPKKSTGKSLTREEELLQENESLKAELALLKKLHALAQARKKKQ